MTILSLVVNSIIFTLIIKFYNTVINRDFKENAKHLNIYINLLLFSLSFVACYLSLHYYNSLILLAYLSLFLFSSVVDIKYKLVPNYALYAISILSIFLSSDYFGNIKAFIITFGLFYLLYYFVLFVFKKEIMGEADIYIISSMSVLAKTLDDVFLMLILASVLALLYMKLLDKENNAFVPHLYLSTIIYLIYSRINFAITT